MSVIRMRRFHLFVVLLWLGGVVGCGALTPSAFQAKGDSATVLQDTRNEESPDDALPPEPSPSLPEGESVSTTERSSGSEATRPGPVAKESSGEKKGGFWISEKKGDVVASFGEVKGPKLDPESAGACLDEAVFADEARLLFSDNPSRPIKKSPVWPERVELPVDHLFAGQFLVQAEVRNPPFGDSWVWKWTDKLPGYVRIIETRPDGKLWYRDLKLQEVAIRLAPAGKGDFRTERYNLVLDGFPTKPGSFLQFYYYINVSVGKTVKVDGKEKCFVFDVEPPNYSRTVAEYTKDVQKNFEDDLAVGRGSGDDKDATNIVHSLAIFEMLSK